MNELNCGQPILSIQNLSVDYETDNGPFSALRDINLDVAPGQILGLVGESGCGKSTLASIFHG